MRCCLERAASLRHKPRLQDFILPNKQRSRTVKIVTIAFASAIALSAMAPAFAYENDLESGVPAPSMQQAAGKHAGHHHAFDARASMPVAAPVGVPPAAPAGAYWDFGIGSQS